MSGYRWFAIHIAALPAPRQTAMIDHLICRTARMGPATLD
jgi:hypothetical protein